MVMISISHGILKKILLCGFLLASAGVGAGGIADNDIDAAIRLATANLQREMTSLREQLELFEMKQETLQTASEHFRLQSKNAKMKLEEERKRYDALASQKQSVELSIESRVAIALENQKALFEDTSAEYLKKIDLLLKENEKLSKSLRHAEYQLQTLEESVKKTLEEKSKQSEISEGKRLVSEKLSTEIMDLKDRLSYSEKQAISFEESWKNATIESEAKDDRFQQESEKRLNEANRWEQRLQKLNSESKELFADNKAKEMDLLRSKKLHLTLLEKLQDSDEAVKHHETKIKTYTTEIEKLSNNLKSASSELSQSKKEYGLLSNKFDNLNTLNKDTELLLLSAHTEGQKTSAKNEQLQNELMDLKLDLETSQNKTKQTIEEKAEMTKAYTQALEQLTLKNNLLRHDLIDTKFEFEQNQNETVALRKKYFDATNSHKEAVDLLQSEERKLEYLRSEYFAMKKELDTLTDEFEKSEKKVKRFQKQIVAETATNEKLQKELLYAELKVENSQENKKKYSDENEELSNMYQEVKMSLERSNVKVLESKRQFQRSQEHVDILQGSLDKLEVEVEETMEKLELKVAKNSYLQKTLLDTRYNLEESQNKIKSLETQLIQASTSGEEFGTLESVNIILMERAQTLEHQLEEASNLYDNAKRKIIDLQSTETKSAQILNRFESMKDENDFMSRNFHLSEENRTEFQSTNQVLRDKNESFEKCGNDLRDTRANYSKLKQDFHAAKVRIDKSEKKILLQEDTIKELKTRQFELETIANQRIMELETLENSNLQKNKDSGNEDLAINQSNTVDTKPKSTMEEVQAGAIKTEGTVKIDAAVLTDYVKDTTDPQSTTERKELQVQKQSRKKFVSFLGWLDYMLYTILRVIVDLVGFLANSVWQILSSSFLFAPIRLLFDIASWTMNELRIIHDALVSLFEFEMTFVSSLVSSEKDRSGFMFLIRHSEIFVMFGEVIGVLLCIDFIVSSFLNPIRARKRRPRAKTIPVPKTATASLLRKANNM